MISIELVVKIPESQYRTLHAKTQADIVDVIDDKLLIDAIKDGVPLPKGHGKIVDIDTIDLNQDEFISQSDYYAAECAVDNAITIVEADKER